MRAIVIIMGVILLPLIVSATELPPVERVMGMSEVNATTSLAIWIPLEDDEALAGLMWYNNDGTVVFPSILAGCGSEDGPGIVNQMSIMAEHIQGGSLQWSTRAFTEPVKSTVNGLYIVIIFPQESEQIDAGTGGGAGIGYSNDAGGLRAWLSWDGLDWMRLHESLNLALVPVIVEADSETLCLDRAIKVLPSEELPPPMALITALQAPAPNPFNPQTKLTFTLARAGSIDLTVHDLRGAVVAHLASGTYSAGQHELMWMGCDDANRHMASGFYIARLNTPEGVMSRKMVLLK